MKASLAEPFNDNLEVRFYFNTVYSRGHHLQITCGLLDIQIAKVVWDLDGLFFFLI